MRTTEERIAAVHQKAAELETESRKKRVRIMQSASVAAGLICIVLMAFFMPDTTAMLNAPTAAENMRGSIFAENGVLGFIVIGILSFLLGVSVTVFCFRLRKWRDAQDKEKNRIEQDKEP